MHVSTFNSLFEMPPVASVPTVWTPAETLSILYLRCSKAPRLEGGTYGDASFNSLFEMRVRRAAEEALERILSILYLRCGKNKTAAPAAAAGQAFQFSI